MAKKKQQTRRQQQARQKQQAKRKEQARKRQQQGTRGQHAAAGRPETTDPLLKEADMQTKAIMRLDAYKRVAYSLVAIGAVLVGVGFFGPLGTVAGIVGIVLLVLGIPSSVVLYLGTKHGRQNVENMIYNYDLTHGTTEERKRQRDVELKGETPEPLRRLNERAQKRGPSNGKGTGRKRKR